MNPGDLVRMNSDSNIFDDNVMNGYPGASTSKWFRKGSVGIVLKSSESDFLNDFIKVLDQNGTVGWAFKAAFEVVP